MAWTTSAGPRGEFALAAGAPARAFQRATMAMAHAGGRRYLPVAAVGLVHLATLVIVAPRAAEDAPLVLLVVLASLAISIAMASSAANAPAFVAAAEAPTDLPLVAATTPAVEPPPARETSAATTGPALASSSAIDLSPAASGRTLSRYARRDLMARVSHELRTPLNAVVGFSDLMGHEMFGPLGHPRYGEYVRHIRDSGHKLLKSTEDTLAITSLLSETGEMAICEEVALATLARDARQIVAVDELRRGIAIGYDIDGDVAVMTHRRALRQALVNLLSEALARSSDASTVVVAARTVGDKVAISVTTSEAQRVQSDGHASLPICLARTLIELTGGELLESHDHAGNWRATTMLERAAQCDFFIAPRPDAVPAVLTV